MKIIDAFWEKRNLNMLAAEVILSDGDLAYDVSTINTNIEQILNQFNYVVVKLPVSCYKLIETINHLGFKFVETQISYELFLNKFKSMKFNDLRCVSDFSIQCVSDRVSYNLVINEIKKNIFTTDRIALDKRFGINISNMRYANWLDDMFNDPESRLYILYYKDEIFGFHAGKVNNDVYIGNFGGLTSKYQNSLLGLYWAYLFLDFVKNDYNAITFACSTNNAKAIRLWQSFGATISSIQYVFSN